MSAKVYSQIIRLVQQAFSLARTVGIQNLLQPGLAKEMVIAELLGHELITSKRDADARHPDNPNVTFEYLSCKEGGSGQLDRMFSRPLHKREQSLQRIRRNSKIYIAIFYTENQIKAKTIYELEPLIVEEEAVRRLDRSSNDISHIGFTESWAKANGRIVFSDK